MTVVVDASALVAVASDGKLGPSNSARALLLANRDEGPVICTSLALSEALAAITRCVHGNRLSNIAGEAILSNLEELPIEAIASRAVRARALELATAMGWARSYDAEHCALAESVDGRLITCDLRLRRGAEGRLPYVVTPDEVIAEAT